MVEKTKRILFLSALFQVPFIALNLMLDVILASHFGASALQISVLATLRPVLAVLAFYWGSVLLFRPELLKFSLVFATGCGTILFVFAPLFDSIWYFIVAECLYVLFLRAANPAQMEILKLNLHRGDRERVFSKYLSISHGAGVIVGPLLGFFLLYYPYAWKELFATVSLIYMISAWMKSSFDVPKIEPLSRQVTVSEIIIKPWKESIRLLKTNRLFFQFQLGFFIAGSGLMFAKPTIPGFLTSIDLSLFEIFSLFTLLEGLGFVLASSMWAKYLEKRGLHAAACFVIICFSLQPILLIMASPIYIFAAYFIYGAAQAGSKLVWNLSGPLLCGNESSSQYTTVNILAIGVRGCCMPLLGAACTVVFGATTSLAVSFLFMLCGAGYLWQRAGKTALESSV